MSRLQTPTARAALSVICLAVLFFGLVTGGPPDNTLIWNSLFDVGHAVLFILVMWLILGISQFAYPAAGRRAIIFGALIATLAIALISEILQMFDPFHDASLGDFFRDAAGASILLLIWLSRSKPTSTVARRYALRGLALLLAVAVVTPLAWVGHLYFERDRSFPTLLRFDRSSWERQFVSVGDATLTVNPGQVLLPGHGDPLALLTLRPAVYPGFVLDEPYPDWRGFARLVFTAFLGEDTPLDLTLRIHDQQHNETLGDRFNRRITIHPGLQTIEIGLDEVRSAPAGRVMDLSQIRGLVIYAYQLNRTAQVYLGPFRLEGFSAPTAR